MHLVQVNFGMTQVSLPEFHIADIIKRLPILEEARKVASYQPPN